MSGLGTVLDSSALCLQAACFFPYTGIIQATV